MIEVPVRRKAGPLWEESTQTPFLVRSRWRRAIMVAMATK